MPPEDQVRIATFRPVKTQGAHVLVAFPCVGLVATIAANFLIEQLKLEEVGLMDGPTFPTLCVVEGGVPHSAVRIYTGDYATSDGTRRDLIIILSEFQPDPDLVRAMAERILAWCRDGNVDLLVTAEGLLLEGEAAEDNIVEVYTAGSTARTLDLIKKANAPLFHEGVVAGITGSLLTIARRESQDVIAVLAEAKRDYPDARSAATVIELLADMVGADVDAGRLYDEADTFERKVLEETRRKQQQAANANRQQELMFG